MNLEDRVTELERLVKDLSEKVSGKKKWKLEEDQFLAHLARTCALTREEVRQRTTKYLYLVMAFQKNHKRSERAITMRLDYKYFGV